MGKAILIAAHLALLALLLPNSSAMAAGQTITPLSFPGGINTQIKAISANGEVITGLADNKAWRWSLQGGTEILGDDIWPRAISADGSTIVGSIHTNPFQSFRWTRAQGLQLLDPHLPGFSYATGVSADGSVVAGLADAGGYRWAAASGMQPLTSINGKYLSPFALSSDGQVFGGQTPALGGLPAGLWTTSGITVLGDLDGGNIDANVTALSADGSVATGIGNRINAPQGFRWTAATGIRPLAHLPGATNTEIDGITADGKIIIGMDLTPTTWEPFQWDEDHGIRRLVAAMQQDRGINLTGWQFYGHSLISADGNAVIVSGTSPTGTYGTFRVGTPIPEPATMILLLSLIPLLRRSHRA